MSKEEQKSELSLAIEARKRIAYPMDVNGFFGLGGKPIHRIAIWVNVKSEQDEAIDRAHIWLSQRTAESARTDPDLVFDTKTVEVLFSACRRCQSGDEEKGWMYPAFPGPAWMKKHLTNDQIACLLNLYHQVRQKENPLFLQLDWSQVEMVALACGENAYNSIPDELLARCDREWLMNAFILLARKYKEAASGSTGGDFEHSAEHAQDADGVLKHPEPDAGDHAEVGQVRSGEPPVPESNT